MSVLKLDYDRVQLCERHAPLEVLRSSLTWQDDACSIIFLEGAAGGGKSTLMNSFITKHCADMAVCSGKFETGNTTEPFSAIAKALDELAQHLLQREDVSVWRSRLEEAFDRSETQVPDSMLPHLSQLMNRPVSRKSAEPQEQEENENYSRKNWGFERMKLGFRSFLHTVSAYVPVVLFLDDLQWASEGPLEVISALLNVTGSDPTKLLFVGANRPVLGEHALRGFQQQLPGYQLLLVESLSTAAVTKLVSRLLCKDEEDPDIQSLAEVVHRKTGGNPFFIIQFLRTLEDEKLIKYSTASYQWVWDLEAILSDTDISQNVVDMIATKIRQTSGKLQSILKTAACLGEMRFDVDTVFFVMDSAIPVDEVPKDVAEMLKLLVPAVEAGLLEQLSKVEFKFAHDRIREGADSLLPAGTEREGFQLALGRRLRKLLESQELEDPHLSLVAVTQLNAGSSLIETEAERMKLAKLNYQAALAATSSSCFSPAADFMRTAVDLLGEKPWDNHHDTMMKITIARTRTEYCCGRLGYSVSLARNVLQNARTFREKNNAYQTIVLCKIQDGRPNEALDTISRVFKELNNPLPERFISLSILRQMLRTKKMLRNMSDEDILGLPDATDENVRFQMGFLERFAELCFFYRKDLIPVALLRMIQAVLQHGHTILSARALAFWGWFNAKIKDYHEAYRFGKLALKVVERLEKDHPDNRAVVIAAHFVMHWRRPYQDSLDSLMLVTKNMWDHGMIEYVMMDIISYLYGYFCAGLSLEALERDNRKYFDLLTAYRQTTHLDHNGQFFQAIANLTGVSEKPLVLTGDFMNENECVRRWTSEQNVDALQQLYYYHMMLGFFYGDYCFADEAASKLPPFEDEPGDERILFRFLLEGIIALILARSHGTRRRRECKRKGRNIIKMFKGWLKAGSPNAFYMLLLLEAENSAGSQAHQDEVRRVFDKAIAAAGKLGVMHNQAIALERAGVYFLDKDEGWARDYLTRARDKYKDWGAHGKVRHMENHYKTLLHCSRETGLDGQQSSGKLRARPRLQSMSPASRTSLRAIKSRGKMKN